MNNLSTKQTIMNKLSLFLFAVLLLSSCDQSFKPVGLNKITVSNHKRLIQADSTVAFIVEKTGEGYLINQSDNEIYKVVSTQHKNEVVLFVFLFCLVTGLIIGLLIGLVIQS